MNKKSAYYSALDSNKEQSLNRFNSFLASYNQSLLPYIALATKKISASTKKYNAFPTDEKFQIPSDQIKIAQSLGQKGIIGVFNQFGYATEDGLALVMDCKKSDENVLSQFLFVSPFKLNNSVFTLSTSPITLPNIVWKKTLDKIDFSSLLNPSSFDREKCALEEAFFKNLYEGIDEQNTPIYKGDYNKRYLAKHKDFELDTSKNILIPVPHEFLSPTNADDAKVRQIIDRLAINYINKNNLQTYTLYSSSPIYDRCINTVYGDGEFYAFAVEYNTFDNMREYVAGNLYCCGSCQNVEPYITQDGKTKYAFNKKRRYLSLLGDKFAYDSFKCINKDYSYPKLSQDIISNWMTDYLLPEFNSLMGGAILTEKGLVEMLNNIKGLRVADNKEAIRNEIELEDKTNNIDE